MIQAEKESAFFPVATLPKWFALLRKGIFTSECPSRAKEAVANWKCGVDVGGALSRSSLHSPALYDSILVYSQSSSQTTRSSSSSTIFLERRFSANAKSFPLCAHCNGRKKFEECFNEMRNEGIVLSRSIDKFAILWTKAVWLYTWRKEQ